MYIKPPLSSGYFYHIYNRGLSKQEIFCDKNDYLRMLSTFSFYLEKKPGSKYSTTPKEKLNETLTNPSKKPLVQISAYCFMPNHFHLILKQIEVGGISEFMRKTLNSYTRYFNTKNKRVGPIFQGKFKAVLISNDEQLLHLSRYIHLNPFIAGLADKPEGYAWSSYIPYLQKTTSRICTPIDFSIDDYKNFVEDYASYAIDLAKLKNSLLDA